MAGAERERHRPLAAQRAGVGDGGRHAARLRAAQVFAVNAAVVRVAVDQVAIVRVGRDAAALAARGDGAPVARGDAAVVAAREDHRRAAVLLRAVEPVRERAVGRDVVELARRLVEPRAPARAAVEADRRALIAGQSHPRRVARIDPELVEVVAVGRAFDRAEAGPAVARRVQRSVGDVHLVGVLGIDRDVAEIPAAPPDAAVGVDPAPLRTAVVAAVEPAVARVDDGVYAPRIARRDGQADLAQPRRGEAAAQHWLPRRAGVGRFVEPAAGAVRGRVGVPGRAARLPQRGEDELAARVRGEVDRAGVAVAEERARPGRAAVGRAVHAARVVGAVGVAERRDQQRLGVRGIDQDAPDLARVLEADAGPRRARVGRAVHAVAVHDVGAHVGFAAAGVHRVRVAGCDRHGADRGHRLRVHHRQPGPPGVGRLPQAAADRAGIVRARIARHAAHRIGAPAAERTDVAPAQAAVQDAIDGVRRLRAGRSGGQREQRERGENRQAETTAHSG